MNVRHLPKVLIVEDESSIAELISVNLRHNGMTPIWAEDGESAQREIDAVLPDVILLDWMLPGQSGVIWARKWRNDPRTKSVPILMLTAKSSENDKVSGLDAGADDYITKPFSTQELLARIRAVLRRRTPEQSVDSVKIGCLSLDGSTHRVTVMDSPIKIGPTEFKLLNFLMHHSERVHTRSQLLDKVWGDHVFIEERTVDVHVKRLREADRKIETLALLDVYGRVARVLLDFSEEIDGERVVKGKLPRQEIAKMIGASREMVSRVMKGLEVEGYIVPAESGHLVLREKLSNYLQ
jgi:two-component system phosphate regulon response regulator PhoB